MKMRDFVVTCQYLESRQITDIIYDQGVSS